MSGNTELANASSLTGQTFYDRDARYIDQDHESDAENNTIGHGGHESASVRDCDWELLQEEEERERILSRPKPYSGLRVLLGAGHNDNEGLVRMSRKQRKQQKRRERRKNTNKDKRRHGDEGQLMFEIEGGQLNDSSSESSRNSMERYHEKGTFTKTSRFAKILHLIFISIGILGLFCALVFGAHRMSRASHRKYTLSILSNGTSNFAPTTILISLDGFRADFLERGLTPTLNSFIAEGVSPKYMLPSFPSVTFPNHYTLVTGLYPESHGVVGNSFWDPGLEEEFYYTDPSRSMQPKWWTGGEPLWVTAENQDVRSAIHMWPGSEAHIQREPTYLDKFNGSEVLSRKVDRILQLLDHPSEYDPGILTISTQRPQFIAAYVPNVDTHGHLYGPNSTEIRQTISKVDMMLHHLFEGLQNRNLTNLVNVVVVSDHGMATTSIDRLIQFDDLVDTNLIEHVDGWPLYGLRPKDPNDLHNIYGQLLEDSARNPNLEVYLKDENMPERYHFSNNDRIAPLWIVPKTGWAIVHKKDFDIEKAKETGQVYRPRGLHGYDHEHPLMRAIFVAKGPAFPHQPGSRLEIFQNIEVYNIICDSLGIIPKPNNGTLRLPFKPIGLHFDPKSSSATFAEGETATDLRPSSSQASSTVITFSSPIKPENPTPSAVITPSSTPSTTPDKTSEEHNENPSNWWAYLVSKLQAAKSWAEDLMSGMRRRRQIWKRRRGK
ncbi:MAG: hypothetical protein Q9187_004101 [Circinaria calcarea]